MPGPSSTAEHTPDLTEEVLGVVREILIGIIGPESAVGISIDLHTSFDVDLEMESIEFVMLNDQLQDRYGGVLDFTEWLATKQLDEIIDLTVGDLVSFVTASLSSTTDLATPPTETTQGEG